MENKVHVKQLKKNYHSLHVLKGIDLDIKEGEVVCLIGTRLSDLQVLVRVPF